MLEDDYLHSESKTSSKGLALIDSTYGLTVWTPLTVASGSAPVSHLGEESDHLNTEQQALQRYGKSALFTCRSRGKYYAVDLGVMC